MLRPVLPAALFIAAVSMSPVAPAAEANAKVGELYAEYCAQCHGTDRRGGQASSLYDGEWEQGSSDEEIATAIRVGTPEMGMPAYDDVLSDEQIRGLVVFIREQEHRHRDRSEEPRPVPGDPVTTRHLTYRIETVVDGGLEIPWAVEPAGDGRLLVTERPGRLRVVAADGSVSQPVAGIPRAVHHGQGGLLDVAVDAEGWIYLAFSDHHPDAGERELLTAVARGRIVDGRWQDQQWVCRFEPEHYTRAGHHFGTRIVLHDEYLFFTIGDRGRGQAAQDLKRPNGSVLRVHRDGRIPEDNPFRDRDDALPQIWSYGHRNPQGLAWSARDQALYSTEHGPRGGDELNRIQAGDNYGWPVITYGINYNGRPITDETARPGMRQPIEQWTPSPALCGMTVVAGDRFAGWQGDLLLGSLKAQELHRVRLRDGEVVEDEIVLTGLGRIRDVQIDRDGSILILLNGPGRLLRLHPVAR